MNFRGGHLSASTQAKKMVESFNLFFSKVTSFAMDSLGEMVKGLGPESGSLPCGLAPLPSVAATNLASFATEHEPPPTASHNDFCCRGGLEEGREVWEWGFPSVSASIKGRANTRSRRGEKKLSNYGIINAEQRGGKKVQTTWRRETSSRPTSTPREKVLACRPQMRSRRGDPVSKSASSERRNYQKSFIFFKKFGKNVC